MLLEILFRKLLRRNDFDAFMSINHKQMSVARKDGLADDSSVILQQLTVDGQAGVNYCYLDETAISEGGYETIPQPGWYLQDSVWEDEPIDASDVTLNPGDIGMIQCAIDEVNFTIQSAL